MPIKHLRVDALEQVVGHRCMEFKRKVWAEDINLGVDGTQVIF